jgi:hypothetical protein
MSITATKVLKAATPDDLEAQMTALLGTYQPHGDAFKMGDWVCMVMIQGTPDVNNNASDAASILDGDTVAVKLNDGSDSHNAVATVSGNALSDVKLAATVAMVDNGDTLSIEPSGTFVDTVTIAVANGVITGITLS